MQLPNSTRAMPRSGIREIMDLALRTPGALRLELGEPDFATPPNIVEAAARAAARGLTKYSATTGVAELREALAEKVRVRNGLSVDARSMLVSAGAVQAIYLSLVGLVDPLSEILIPDPGWPNYLMMCRLLRARPVGYPLEPEHAYLPALDALEARVTPATRAIVLNSPSNPLGAVFTEERLRAVVEWANDHGLWIISDECYDELTFDRPNLSAARFDTKDSTISVFSFSKTYAMTGWRIGYAAIPEAAVQTLTSAHEAMLSSVAMPTQYAALEAVTGPQDAVVEMRAAYRRRRDLGLAALAAEQIPVFKPEGAFYLWVDVRESGLRSDDFARRLLAEEAVAVAPGTAFGAGGADYIRLSIASSDATILEAIERIGRLVSVRAPAS